MPSCRQGTAVSEASKISEAHGERDAHRLFQRRGLRLEVPTSKLHVGAGEEGAEPVVIPYLKLDDFFKVLLNKHPRLLFGGMRKGPDAEHLCEVFWERFECYHPQHSIYQKLSKEDRKKTVPVLFHGDKGRGLQKSPLFCFSWETAFSLPLATRRLGSKRDDVQQKRKVHGARMSWSCSQRAQGCEFERAEAIPRHGACSVTDRTCVLRESLEHNGRGNTMLSRFLVAGVPKKMLSKNDSIVPSLMTEVASNLTTLFETGVRDNNGVLYRAAFIGTKGDYEFLQLDCGDFQRTYMNEGRIASKGMCPECWAGCENFPATDMADVPAWVSTLYRDLPWTSEPPLCKAPYAETQKPGMFKRDMFHTLKYGFCRDLCASVLFLLGMMSYFDPPDEVVSQAVDERLRRAHSMFAMWCAAESHCPTLRKFTKANLHRKKPTTFPWLGGKGSDTVLCMMFLDFFVRTCLREVRDESHQQVLCAMAETLRGGLDFIGILHSHGIFLPHSCAVFMHRSGLRLLRGYTYLAVHCMDRDLKLFSLRPKTHYFAHTLWDMGLQISLNHEWICSPALFNCEANEDFVGKISRLSRRVSPRLCGQRVIDRYLVGAKLFFKRARV